MTDVRCFSLLEVLAATYHQQRPVWERAAPPALMCFRIGFRPFIEVGGEREGGEINVPTHRTADSGKIFRRNMTVAKMQS